MRRKYMGDCMGEMDEAGIAQWYPNCKVRFDGSHYIATPHTTNTAKRTKRVEKKITVSEANGKFKLEGMSTKNVENAPETNERLAVDRVSAANEESSFKCLDESPKSVRSVTRKTLFDELYDKYLFMKPKERKKAIYMDMQPLFDVETDLQIFIEKNCYRRWRNLVVRRQRFARKAHNQNFQWFVTFTYADEKHTEESFKKRLLETLRRLATRHNWKYMGVWERGKDTDRLHFHALVHIPENEMVGAFEEKKDYNKKIGRQKTFIQNTFFAKRFGRNEFDSICGAVSYGKAIGYIMKYMEKQNVKAVYSRGLYEYFHSDIRGEDVVAKMELLDETDNRLILAPHFTCWDEGALIGEVSQETIAKLPKSV